MDVDGEEGSAAAALSTRKDPRAAVGSDPFTPAFSSADLAGCSGVMEALQMLTTVTDEQRAAFFTPDRRPSNRFEQVLLWLGERSDGMLVMDESHKGT